MEASTDTPSVDADIPFIATANAVLSSEEPLEPMMRSVTFTLACARVMTIPTAPACSPLPTRTVETLNGAVVLAGDTMSIAVPVFSALLTVLSDEHEADGAVAPIAGEYEEHALPIVPAFVVAPGVLGIHEKSPAPVAVHEIDSPLSVDSASATTREKLPARTPFTAKDMSESLNVVAPPFPRW
ncbi:hypothetical protein G3N18_10165 [Microbacterium sp. 2C]|uniref:hypothetical protein n=1 Tax=Microbacterium paulum TaxID=2707006 RepID=UPI0018C2E2C3|nr:hypothetical protein [Microbacterium paulum]MBG0718423.1 hypothetical protein [Microbacterium paulum]